MLKRYEIERERSPMRRKSMDKKPRFKMIIGEAVAVAAFLLSAVAMAQEAGIQAAASTQAPVVGAVDQGDKDQKKMVSEMRALSDTVAARHIDNHIRFISSGASPHNPWSPYMKAWVSQVEAAGTRNFPSEARKSGVHAQPIVNACMLKSGKLASVDVIRSSGSPSIDAAAVQAVRSAGPFAPLISSEAGVEKLCILRTFTYLHGSSKS